MRSQLPSWLARRLGDWHEADHIKPYVEACIAGWAKARHAIGNLTRQHVTDTVDSWIVADFRRRATTHALNAAAFLLFSAYVLHRNQPLIAQGVDGAFFRHMIDAQATWWPFGLDYAFNPLQGLFDLFHPHNLNIEPATVLYRLTGDPASVTSLFVWYGFELFLTAVIFVKVIGMGDRVTAVAGWILPILAIPYIRPWVFYPIFALDPTAITLMLAASIMLAALKIVRAQLTWQSVGAAILVVALPGYMIAVNTTLVVVVVPFIAFYVFFLVFDEARWRDRIAKISALSLVLLVLILFQFVQLWIGVMLHTAPYFFFAEIPSYLNGLFFMSVFYQVPAYSLGLYTVIGALAGCLVGATCCASLRRSYAARQGILTCVFLAFGLAFAKLVGGWSGPAPVYFEIPFWTAYATFIAVLFVAIGHLVLEATYAIGFRFRIAGAHTRPRHTWIGDAIPAAIVFVVALVVLSRLCIAGPNVGYRYPPGTSAITDFLAKEIALKPGAQFRGVVATFAGYSKSPSGTDWLHIHDSDSERAKAIGNDHRLVGLWDFHIPTLVEYNQALSPELFLMSSRLLMRPTDRQVRNIVIHTNPDLRYLRSIGVRFIISDFTISDTMATLVKSIDTPKGSLYLYELAQPNLGQYSPVRAVTANTFNDAIAALRRDPNLDDYFIAGAPLSAPLVPARSGKIFIEPNKITVTAESSGRSVLILPVQYSHCWVVSENTASPPIKLFRANVLQLGIEFESKLQTSLQFRFGPFGKAGCRLTDINDLNTMSANRHDGALTRVIRFLSRI